MRHLLFALLLSPIGLFAQQNDDAFRKQLQTQMILAEPGDTIDVPAGTHLVSSSLSLDEKQNVVIRGAGMDETIISFKKQRDGAEGIRIANSSNITIMDLTVQDAAGDCIKVMDTDGIAFLRVRTEWTGRAKKTNGAYGLYPVSCQRVLIDGCEAIGASDAGIYVGQSHQIIVRNSLAYRNVAGIEIENSTMADVYDCEAYENTGGILVFDLPDLPKEKGGNVRVFRNHVHHNNFRNFAPKGNIVGTVPPGTGVLILATNNVEIFENKVLENKTVGAGIISYYMTENPIQDDNYYPYPTSIYIHDNTFAKARKRPTLKNKIGILLLAKFGKDVPDILYDGIVDKETLAENGSVKPEFQICIRNNGEATFANLDAEHNFVNLNQDISVHDCTRTSLDEPSLGAARGEE
ncbi:MAG: right-handed parallel beta-helix repeat-containing protein [Bacteroidia bacterium]|nr:right-handed parallel beta-helix repeat-containing protein [Bacteroidia bacterium]